jgi:hypothetical protein
MLIGREMEDAIMGPLKQYFLQVTLISHTSFFRESIHRLPASEINLSHCKVSADLWYMQRLVSAWSYLDPLELEDTDYPAPL